MQLRQGWAVVFVLAAALAFTNAVRADDKVAEPASGDKATDTKIYNSLREVINVGADRFNQLKDYWGCYRLYEGALMATKPFLGHRPNLQKDIDAGIAEAERTTVVHEKAFVLRRVIDKVRDETNPNPKTPPVAKTLWERLGGEANVKKVVDDFVDAAAKDPKVDFFRGGKYKPDAAAVANLKKQLVDQISSLTGGPYPYKGKSMKDAHKGMEITSEQFDALAGLLKTALEKNGAKPEDVKTIIEAVAKTKPEIVEGKKPVPPPAKVLWERMGGEPVAKKVVADFVAALNGDKKVDFTRGGKIKLEDKDVVELNTKLVAFISQATGGPIKYDGKSVREVFKELAVTDEQFTAANTHLKNTLTKNDVKGAEADEILAKFATLKADIVQK